MKHGRARLLASDQRTAGSLCRTMRISRIPPSTWAAPVGNEAVVAFGQLGSPKPLPDGQEAWVVEHYVRQQSRYVSCQHRTFTRAICATSPTRAGRTASGELTRRIVGQPQHLPHRYKSQADSGVSGGLPRMRSQSRRGGRLRPQWITGSCSFSCSSPSCVHVRRRTRHQPELCHGLPRTGTNLGWPSS